MSCNSLNFTGNLAIPVGFDFKTKITYVDSNDNPIPLENYSFSMSIRPKNSSTDLLTLFIVNDQVTSGLYIPDFNSGAFYIQVRQAQTLAVGAGMFDYFIPMTTPSGDNELFLYGDVSFNQVG